MVSKSNRISIWDIIFNKRSLSLDDFVQSCVDYISKKTRFVECTGEGSSYWVYRRNGKRFFGITRRQDEYVIHFVSDYYEYYNDVKDVVIKKSEYPIEYEKAKNLFDLCKKKSEEQQENRVNAAEAKRQRSVKIFFLRSKFR